ncbi:hypothetical protein TEA_008531 [Camellia sinensis var. sinensis]|uniref:TRF2/HOY1 PH-like domain-containing protein n=1 Tax=Camellia sinensis var. sinensis TaxID=542762 RepID=A0A4S4DS91_CAMSN|nr:hypothetical protein TEA_008531 [Camellia sinensis var. sinensis]
MFNGGFFDCSEQFHNSVLDPVTNNTVVSGFPSIDFKRIKLSTESNQQKKIVWEVLERALKSKIKIQWSDIQAIRAIIRDDEPGILEIELNQQPQFFRETNPQPRKHTLWQQAMDFTGGQAPIYRRHYIKFPPRTLDKHYEKLLQCDKRLLELSQKPFPRMESPFFYSNIYEVTDIPFDFTVRRSQFPSTLQHCFSTILTSLVPAHPIQNFKLTTRQPFGIVDSNSPMSGDSQNVCSNERTLIARVSSMCSLLNPFEVANPQNDNSMNQLEYKQGKFSNDHLILGTTEHSRVNGGLCYPQPICCLAPRVSNESHMMHVPRDNSSYPYDFYHPEVNDYGLVDTGHEVHQ